MIWRLINIQGVAGIAVGLCLAMFLVLQKGETRHWRTQSDGFELLYRGEQAAHLQTVANYRAAADAARAADRAHIDQVAAGDRALNQRISDDFQARLAAARLAAARVSAQRLRGAVATSAANPGARRTAVVPAPVAAPGGAAGAPAQDGFPGADRLIATEQAIQLDELIDWVEQQRKAPPDPASVHP